MTIVNREVKVKLRKVVSLCRKCVQEQATIVAYPR